MLEKIKSIIERIDILSKEKPITVISHFDTDGITAAAIFSKALERWKKPFNLRIIKNLEKETIEALPDSSILIFLDLASNSLDYLKEKKTEVFILDHHEIIQDIPENVTMINPHLDEADPISGAGLAYLFAKTISSENKDLATLAVIGMVGDMLEKNLSKKYDEIIKDSETTIKKGILFYPSTRPLDRTLEYSSNPYIPGVTGNYKGVLELLRDAKITNTSGKFKALYELTEEEMSNLITAIMLRDVKEKNVSEMIGNLYLVKFFNKLEDARELSALINACSRMGNSETALGFCLGNKTFKKKAEKIYVTYKQHLVSALKYVEKLEKMVGDNYIIINAQDQIKDTIVGTVASIMSFSPVYDKGTIIVALAHSDDKIKVSARLAGREGRNVREVLNNVVAPMGGEVGGHPAAAGCLIAKEDEEKFINNLKKELEIEVVTPTSE